MEQAVVSLGGTAIRAFVSMSQNRRPSGDCVCSPLGVSPVSTSV